MNLREILADRQLVIETRSLARWVGFAIVAILLATTVNGYTQKHSNKKSSEPRQPNAIFIDQGVVQGKTYKNVDLGIELTPASNLRFDTPRLMGSPATGHVLVTVGAWSEEDWQGMKEGTTFYAELLVMYPEDQRSAEDYMKKVVRQQTDDGFQQPKNESSTRLAGTWFVRSDFLKDSVYEAVFVKACDQWMFVFIFSGHGFEAVKRLIDAADVKFDVKKSGCTVRSEKNGQ